jgi:secreted Zn-dependent insulinase-like peptidase
MNRENPIDLKSIKSLIKNNIELCERHTMNQCGYCYDVIMKRLLLNAKKSKKHGILYETKTYIETLVPYELEWMKQRGIGLEEHIAKDFNNILKDFSDAGFLNIRITHESESYSRSYLVQIVMYCDIGYDASDIPESCSNCNNASEFIKTLEQINLNKGN